MAAFSQWHRYIFASVSKHFLDLADVDSIEVVVEFANFRTPTWETADSNVEITITGPTMVPLSKGAYRAEVAIFAIVSSFFGTNGLEHIDVIGKVSDWTTVQAKGIAHIAICVSDLEQSLRFYRDVLGMQVKLHTTQEMARRPGAGSKAMYETSHSSRTVRCRSGGLLRTRSRRRER